MTIETLMNEYEIFESAIFNGWVAFSYFKTDGTIRQAIGTRNIKEIEKHLPPKDTDKKHERTHRHNPSTFVYFDLIKNDYRSFRICNFNHLVFKAEKTLNYAEALEYACAVTYSSNEFESEDYNNAINALSRYNEDLSASVSKKLMDWDNALKTDFENYEDRDGSKTEMRANIIANDVLASVKDETKRAIRVAETKQTTAVNKTETDKIKVNVFDNPLPITEERFGIEHNLYDAGYLFKVYDNGDLEIEFPFSSLAHLDVDYSSTENKIRLRMHKHD